jgi:hypothetical protein
VHLTTEEFDVLPDPLPFVGDHTETSFVLGDQIRFFHLPQGLRQFLSRDYFLAQWDKSKHYPGGVLAHSTHLRSMGIYENGVERPRIRMTLATGIAEEHCRRLNLGCLDLASINVDEWEWRGVVVVHKAGEMLYQLKEG